MGRNMSVNGFAAKGSDGNEEHYFGNWRKGNSCYRVIENLDELCLEFRKQNL